MDIFDILGPVMVGPSSSHTAGAVRIGSMARTLLNSPPVKAAIHLHGSFADTGLGHGTDRALVAGLLGMKPDDLRIPSQLRINVANMSLYRHKRGGDALMIIETDEHIKPNQVAFLSELPGILSITYYDREEDEDVSGFDEGNL